MVRLTRPAFSPVCSPAARRSPGRQHLGLEPVLPEATESADVDPLYVPLPGYRRASTPPKSPRSGAAVPGVYAGRPTTAFAFMMHHRAASGASSPARSSARGSSRSPTRSPQRSPRPAASPQRQGSAGAVEQPLDRRGPLSACASSCPAARSPRAFVPESVARSYSNDPAFQEAKAAYHSLVVARQRHFDSVVERRQVAALSTAVVGSSY